MPAAAAFGDGVNAADTIALVNPPFTDRSVQTRGFVVPVRRAVASSNWISPGESRDPSPAFPMGQLWSKRYLPDEVSPDSTVLFPIGERDPEELFGLTAEAMPGERVGGESFTSNNPFLVALPGDLVFGERSFETTEILNAGGPIPTGGGSYGMGVLVTPEAEFAGQSANPLTGISLEEILTNEMASQMLSNAGVTDAESVEWQADPTEVTDVPDGTSFTDVPDGTEFADLSI